MEHRWLISPQNPELSASLAGEMNIHPSVAQVLINRGAESAEQARTFLSSDLGQLRDPFELPGVAHASDILCRAIVDNRPIGIFGDYDADGLTSVALFKTFLRSVGRNCVHYVPNRLTEGYGLSEAGLDSLARAGAELVVTADCGSTDVDEAETAHRMGLELIITDHHQLGSGLPRAAALINPWLEDSPPEFQGLAGVGVVFFLLIGLRSRLRDAGHITPENQPNLKQLLDLVALGTIADVSPMVEQNRILVKTGLNILASGPRPGLEALATVARIKGGISSRDVLFQLAPRINAPGRMGPTETVVDLLMSQDASTARAGARQLDDLNKERRKVESRVFKLAREQLTAQGDPRERMALVAADENWHKGVLGIVAAKLSREFNRPSVVLAVEGDIATGSGRSIESVHLHRALQGLEDYLIQYGGHSQAAGVKLRQENIRPFSMALNTAVGSSLASADVTPAVNIDAALELDDIDYDLIADLECLAPFGPRNPEPVFAADDVGLISARQVGRNGAHLAVSLRQGSRTWQAIGFDFGRLARRLPPRVSVAFRPFVDTFNGREMLKLQIEAIQAG